MKLRSPHLLWIGLAFAAPLEAGVGRQSSVAIGTDGLALISYSDYTHSALKVAHCSDLLCTTAKITTLGFGGDTTSLGIGGDGLGLIAYGSFGTSVGAAHCLDVMCRSATRSASLFAGDGVHSFVGLRDMVIGADGLGFLTGHASQIQFQVTSLSGRHCSNAACTSFTFTPIASASLVEGLPGGVSAVAADGRPWIGYGRRNPLSFEYELVVSQCQDAACSATSPGVGIGPGRAPLAAATGSDGLGIMAWTSETAGLQLAHCGNAPCSSATSVLLDAAGPIRDAALAMGSDGLPLIAYVSGDDLKVVHCNDPACTTSTRSLLDGPSQVTDNGLAIGADGLGLISYHDAAAGVLKVAHCQDVACTSATLTVPSPEGPFAADLSVQLSHFPEPVTGLQTLTYLIGSANLGPDDASGVSIALDLPAGVVFQSASGTGWTCGQAGGRVTCSREVGILTLPEIQVRVTAPPTAQVVSATATISSSVADPAPGNNTDTETATVTAAPLAEVAVAMSDGGAVVHPGQPFTWTITVTNLGGTPVTGAVVVDVFPATVLNVSWTCVPGDGATCPPTGTGDILASVTLGSSATFTATGTLSPTTYVLSNTATVTPPATSYDPNPADNTATVSSQSEPTQAYTLTPCRLVDTRSTHPPALGVGERRSFPVAGTCGVPADARAVAVIVTAVSPGDVGDFRLYPAGANVPMASSVNFAPGRTRAGNAVVPLGTDGQVSVQCDMPDRSPATVHLVLDVYAYFK